MKITVVGAGNVGRTLGARFAQLGHSVIFTARDLQGDKIKAALAEAGNSAKAEEPLGAARDADLIILATQYADAANALSALGDIAGKAVVDTTNPLKPDLSGLSIGFETSAAEELQRAFPSARIVKAFNSTGFNIMANPPAGAVMMVASDDEAAKKAALDLAAGLGFQPQDAGPLSQARLLEPLAMLWISLAYRQGVGRDYTFSMTRAD